jgi:hypothetical protein
MAGLHGYYVFDITKKAYSARFGICHRCEIMRHRIRFADAHRAARGSLDWAHGCATLRPVLVQVGETQRMVANFCEMAVRERNPTNSLLTTSMLLLYFILKPLG